MTILFNKTETKNFRKFLRKNSPTPESIVWSKLKNRQLENTKWRRQYSVGDYIIDFYCPEKKLAIEIDGDSHYHRKAIIQDKEREKYIKSFGIKFLRFTNDQVMRNLDGILNRITENLTSPLPLLEKERSQ